MVIGVVAPICVQVDPSADWKALKLSPLRTRRTHVGAATTRPFTLDVLLLGVVRNCARAPPVGVTSAKALGAPTASDCRIITPAFAVPLVFSSVAMRAI